MSSPPPPPPPLPLRVACSLQAEAELHLIGWISASSAPLIVTWVNLQSGCGAAHPTTSTPPPPHRVCVCAFTCVFSSFTCLFLCVCSRHCDLFTMHAFTTSLCVVCCCVCVCPSCRKTITVRILDREEYNKQSSFHLLLESPRWMRSGTEQTGLRANQPWGIPSQQARHRRTVSLFASQN